MEECEKLANCAFFKEYEKDEERKLALRGFANMYCRGDKQDICIRKKISKLLGGAEFVPVNMMPNGLPLKGTSSENWSDDVKNIMKNQ
jgi:hypothetical protein